MNYTTNGGRYVSNDGVAKYNLPLNPLFPSTQDDLNTALALKLISDGQLSGFFMAACNIRN